MGSKEGRIIKDLLCHVKGVELAPLEGNGEPLEVLNRRVESLDLCFRKIVLVSSVEAMDQREKKYWRGGDT